MAIERVWHELLDERAAAPSDNLTRFAGVLRLLPAPAVPLVLDLGCGTARCALAIQERWPGVGIVGLDRDRAALKHRPNVVAPVQADLCAMPVPMSRFGLIVIRHPDVHRAPERWQAAIRAAPQLLCVGGLLLVTCYSLSELDQIRRWLADSRTELPSAAQPFAFTHKSLTSPDGVGHDRYPAAWRFTGG
ncbi:MAG: class I SAM-dependent methyltransferase [Aggregatilineales bacterium]